MAMGNYDADNICTRKLKCKWSKIYNQRVLSIDVQPVIILLRLLLGYQWSFILKISSQGYGMAMNDS